MNVSRGRIVTAATLVLLLTALAVFHRPLVGGMLPIFRKIIDVVAWPLGVSEIRLVQRGADQSVETTFKVLAPLRLRDGRVIKPDPRGAAVIQLSAAKALQPIAFLLVVCLLWPWLDKRELYVRAALGLTLVPLLIALDFPMVITGSIFDLMREQQPQLVGNPAQAVGAFMEAGGRIGSGLAGGALISASARWLVDGWA